MNPQFVLNAEEIVTKNVLQKGFKKVKRRWLTSIAFVLLVIPVLFLSWGQYCGRGFSFTNIHEFVIARAFLSDLEKEDYEAAFSHLNLDYVKERWLDEWLKKKSWKTWKKMPGGYSANRPSY